MNNWYQDRYWVAGNQTVCSDHCCEHFLRFSAPRDDFWAILSIFKSGSWCRNINLVILGMRNFWEKKRKVVVREHYRPVGQCDRLVQPFYGALGPGLLAYILSQSNIVTTTLPNILAS